MGQNPFKTWSFQKVDENGSGKWVKTLFWTQNQLKNRSSSISAIHRVYSDSPRPSSLASNFALLPCPRSYSRCCGGPKCGLDCGSILCSDWSILLLRVSYIFLARPSSNIQSL